jgi:hypothetical protein
VTVARRHRVVVEPIAHQRQRGDTRRELLAGVARRRRQRLEGGKIALQPLADRPMMAAQTVRHSTAVAFQQMGVQRREALEHRDWYEVVPSRVADGLLSTGLDHQPASRNKDGSLARAFVALTALTPRHLTSGRRFDGCTKNPHARAVGSEGCDQSYQRRVPARQSRSATQKLSSCELPPLFAPVEGEVVELVDAHTQALLDPIVLGKREPKLNGHGLKATEVYAGGAAPLFSATVWPSMARL